MNEEETTQFEEALEQLPEEVKDFLYNGAFDEAVDHITQTHQLSEEQKKTFDMTLTEVICLLTSKDTLIELFTSWGFTQEKQAAIAKKIDEHIFLPIIEATNYIVEYEDEKEENKVVPDLYEEIQKRFLYGTPLVKTEKKSYSLDTLPPPPRPESSTMTPPQNIYISIHTENDQNSVYF